MERGRCSADGSRYIPKLSTTSFQSQADSDAFIRLTAFNNCRRCRTSPLAARLLDPWVALKTRQFTRGLVWTKPPRPGHAPPPPPPLFGPRGAEELPSSALGSRRPRTTATISAASQLFRNADMCGTRCKLTSPVGSGACTGRTDANCAGTTLTKAPHLAAPPPAQECSRPKLSHNRGRRQPTSIQESYTPGYRRCGVHVDGGNEKAH